MPKVTYALLVTVLILGTSCADTPTPGASGGEIADVVYTNGRIYTVNEAQSWAEAVAIKDGKFELFLRYQPGIQQKSGYQEVPDSILESSNKYYYGNADRYYTRFRYSYRTNISIGFTAEKDPGEQFFKGAQKQGFDFYSFHAFYRGGKYLKSFALGDYQIQLGQGLN